MIDPEKFSFPLFCEYAKKQCDEVESMIDNTEMPHYEKSYFDALAFLVPKIDNPGKDETDDETIEGIVKVLALSANYLKDMETCSEKILAFDGLSKNKKPINEAYINSYITAIAMKQMVIDQILKRFPSILRAIEQPLNLSAFPEISESERNFLDYGEIIQTTYIKLETEWITKLLGDKFIDETPIIEDIPQLKLIPYEKNYFVNCKVEKQIKKISSLAAVNAPDNPFTISVDVTQNGKKQSLPPVLVQCTLSFNSDNVTYSREITEGDRNVANAVTSLYVTGKELYGKQADIIITPEMISRTMNGIREYVKSSDAIIEEITESMDRLMHTFVKIDCSNEARQRKLIDKDGNCIIEGALIPATKVTAISGGTKKSAYEINRCPVLYQYASTVNRQVIKINPQLLDIHELKDGKPGKRIPNTMRRTEIKSYILRRIEVMKGGKVDSHRILYSTLYDEIGLDNPSKTERSRIKSYIEQVLAHIQSLEHIKGFEPVTKGRSIIGVDIKF